MSVIADYLEYPRELLAPVRVALDAAPRARR